jgi:mitochondrial import inner membrane translocase subunit TIM9
MSQQEALLNEINKLQMRDMLRLYNEMAEMCFNKCVTSFRSKELNGKENSCLDLCVGKYMKNMTRCGMRFAEEQYVQQQQAGGLGGGGGMPPQ